MLVDEIKARMFQAMKAGKTVEKEILRVAMGEITTEAARPGRLGNDEESAAIVRKLIKSNEESLGHTTGAAEQAVLKEELEVLASLLPKGLDENQILHMLASVADAIKSAGNDGQATGIAMKALKSTGASVGGKDVAAAVKRIRSGA
jgi:uncharacterized protein